MTPCDRYQEQISCLIDGELNPAEQRALAEHVRTCRACRRMYTAFRGVSAVIADADAEPPSDLTARIMQQVRSAPPILTTQRPAAYRSAPQAKRPARRPAQRPVDKMPQPQRQPIRQTPRQTEPRTETAKRKKGRISPLVPIGTIAACLVLAVGIIAFFGPSGKQTPTANISLSDPKVTQNSVRPTPEPTQSDDRTDLVGDMVSALPENTDCVVFSVPEDAAEPINNENELKITDTETIRSLSELLASDQETDPVPDSIKPVCVLQDTDAANAQSACTVWLIGNDIVFRIGEDGSYYLVSNAANAFRQLLDLPAA